MSNITFISFTRFSYVLAILFLSFLVLSACSTESTEEEAKKNDDPHVVAKNQIEAGRYLVTIGGCNDCHTEGYLQTEGKIPEKDWLTGSSLGWQGPWGTTYPSNLRLTAQDLDEEEWVMVLHERTDMPPMPWMNINKMSEADAKAIYQYIKLLGPAGDYVPDALDPGEEPVTPYLSLIPKNLPEQK